MHDKRDEYLHRYMKIDASFDSKLSTVNRREYGLTNGLSDPHAKVEGQA